MSESENLDPLTKYFITYRGTPKDAKKDLLSLLQDNNKVEEAYEKFMKLMGRTKSLVPPPPIMVENQDKEGWYPGADYYQDAIFWPALRSHLLEDKKWSIEAVDSIHQATDKIVYWLGSPYAARINTKGLVVGYVQSGKTANFTAVIAKAADAGYRFFIVLSGTKKSLRQQTQLRLENEITSLNDDVWFTPTSMHDFKPNSLGNPNFFLSDRKHDKVLCVVKKNSRILSKLLIWLDSADQNTLWRCPFLIIDDEADEASINTARYQYLNDPQNRERTAINRHLVKLLDLLPKAAYVGYTATPFANVLIDPSYGIDLYPKDFIVSLPKPSNHFGTEDIFGRSRLLDEETEEEFEGLDVVRIIDEDEVPLLRPKRFEHDFVPEMTSSLKTAILYFWLACAVRFARGQQNEHSTMLIHTTQLTLVHNSTRQVIENYRDKLLNELNGPNAEKIVQDLHALWEKEKIAVPIETANVHLEVTFEQLYKYVEVIIDKTFIVADNYRSEHRLSYEGEPKIQIVVGGNTLSRGLTLEGLIVSFFIRAARAYDTLLQMGRWFGYRPGYSDLPRIWMTEELRNNFYDLATVEAEVRQDIELYAEYGLKPSQFGVRIRTHPDLNITARLKMQHAAIASVSYGGKNRQTVTFHEKKSSLAC